jgi:hypothetical protein
MYTGVAARRFMGVPRYLVQRTFPDGFDITADACGGVVERNAEDGVTWIHSYVTQDRRASFCVYDAPTPEAVRRAARRNHLPIDRITQVRVLDPYFLVEARPRAMAGIESTAGWASSDQH